MGLVFFCFFTHLFSVSSRYCFVEAATPTGSWIFFFFFKEIRREIKSDDKTQKKTCSVSLFL